MSDRFGDQVSELIRAVERLTLVIQNNSSGSQAAAAPSTGPENVAGGESEFELVSEVSEPVSQPAPSRRQVSAIAFNDYNSFAEVIPPVPHWILRECRSLVEGDFSIEYRAKRAWEAGYWASLTIQGKVRSPRASPSLPLRPKVYVVLRAPGLEAPTRVSNASDFYRITGRLEGSNVVCHSFPSLAEATAYCEGAGYRLPAHHQWR